MRGAEPSANGAAPSDRRPTADRATLVTPASLGARLAFRKREARTTGSRREKECRMCPLCLTTVVVTIASTTGAGAAVSALVLRINRSVRKTQRTFR